MATAICKTPACGHTFGWDNPTGARLADVRCPKCGGACRGPNAGKPNANHGKTYRKCAVCGRKGLRMPYVRFAFKVSGFYAGLRFEAGMYACGTHPVCPAESEDTRYLFVEKANREWGPPLPPPAVPSAEIQDDSSKQESR